MAATEYLAARPIGAENSLSRVPWASGTAEYAFRVAFSPVTPLPHEPLGQSTTQTTALPEVVPSR